MPDLESLPEIQGDVEPLVMPTNYAWRAGEPWKELRDNPENENLFCSRRFENRRLIYNEFPGPISRKIPDNISVPNKTYRQWVLDALKVERRGRIWRIRRPVLITRRGTVYIGEKIFGPSVPINFKIKNVLRLTESWLEKHEPETIHSKRILSAHNGYPHYFHGFEDFVGRAVYLRQAGKWFDPCLRVPDFLDEAQSWQDLLDFNVKPSVTRVPFSQGYIRAKGVTLVRQPYCDARVWKSIAASIPTRRPSESISPCIVLIRKNQLHQNRSCLGYDALVKSLVERGYSAVDPANYSLAEQKYIFGNAKHIVSENGSALTNIVFCDPSKVFIDSIVPQHWATVTFQCLSASLGLRFRSHLVRSEKTEDRIQSLMDIHTANKILAVSGE